MWLSRARWQRLRERLKHRSLLSGGCLGKTVFEVSPIQQEVFVANLKQAAVELAVEQSIMESRQQQSQVVLSGCGGVLPDEVLVWEGAAVIQDALEAQLLQLISKMR